jgi:hypothetical protein
MTAALTIELPGATFSRVAHGLIAQLPSAARRIYDLLHSLYRPGCKIRITDREIASRCGCKRRCVQKGLRQLQDIGLIDRIRAHGGRIISWLIPFRAKKTTRSPRDKATRPAPRTDQPAPTSTETRLPEDPAKLLDELQAEGWAIESHPPHREFFWSKIRDDATKVSRELAARVKANMSAIQALVASRPARE